MHAYRSSVGLITAPNKTDYEALHSRLKGFASIGDIAQFSFVYRPQKKERKFVGKLIDLVCASCCFEPRVFRIASAFEGRRFAEE